MRNDELRRIRPGQRIVWRRLTDEPVELLLVEEVLARYEQQLSDIGVGYRWYQDSSGGAVFRHVLRLPACCLGANQTAITWDSHRCGFLGASILDRGGRTRTHRFFTQTQQSCLGIN